MFGLGRKSSESTVGNDRLQYIPVIPGNIGNVCFVADTGPLEFSDIDSQRSDRGESRDCRDRSDMSVVEGFLTTGDIYYPSFTGFLHILVIITCPFFVIGTL